MQFDFYSFVRMLWHQKPSIIILFVGGLFVFVLLVIDAHRFKKWKLGHRTERRPSSEFRSQLLPCAQQIRAFVRNRARRTSRSIGELSPQRVTVSQGIPQA
jgi:hypothetical protein